MTSKDLYAFYTKLSGLQQTLQIYETLAEKLKMFFHHRGGPSANKTVMNVKSFIIENATAPSTQVSQPAEYKQRLSRVHEMNTSSTDQSTGAKITKLLGYNSSSVPPATYTI